MFFFFALSFLSFKCYWEAILKILRGVWHTPLNLSGGCEGTPPPGLTDFCCMYFLFQFFCLKVNFSPINHLSFLIFFACPPPPCWKVKMLKSENINLYYICFRKKNESLNYLRMSSKVDATSSRWKKNFFQFFRFFSFYKIRILFSKIKKSWFQKHSQPEKYE